MYGFHQSALDLFIINVLKIYYQYCHYQLPLYLHQFAYRSELHNYDIRNKNNLYMSIIRTKAAEYSFRHVTPKIINVTPKIILDTALTHSLPVLFFILNNISST